MRKLTVYPTQELADKADEIKFLPLPKPTDLDESYAAWVKHCLQDLYESTMLPPEQPVYGDPELLRALRATHYLIIVRKLLER